MKILMILILLSFESDWLLCCLLNVWMVILGSRGGMEVFLLEEDIIVNQQIVRKQKQVQIKSGIIYCCWLKNLTTGYGRMFMFTAVPAKPSYLTLISGLCACHVITSWHFILLIDEMLMWILGCKYITYVNIITAFNKLQMHLNSKDLIIFIISFDVFKYKNLFFNLINELMFYQQYMNEVLFNFFNCFV